MLRPRPNVDGDANAHDTLVVVDELVENMLGQGAIATSDLFDDCCPYESEVKPEVLASDQVLQLFKRIIKSAELSTLCVARYNLCRRRRGSAVMGGTRYAVMGGPRYELHVR